MERIEKFNNLFFGFLAIMFFPISGLMFYTKEYAGNGKNIGPIKEILDNNISLSVLMIIIIILLFLIIGFGMIKYILSVAKKEVERQVEIKLNRVKLNNISDRNTLDRIEDLLPVDYMINFFQKKDFEIQTFSIDDIDLMEDFLDSSNSPNIKFIDEDLEKHRNLMITKMRVLSNLLRNNNEQLGVSNAWRIPRNNKTDVFKLANTYSLEIWEEYEKILTDGRKKLGDRDV
ncbi:hypothetical protein FQP34_00195 [Peribacillus simplex]|uniref:Uncharacterized protein n=1 Tax=Peribacillus simplex TaxID=1478 RepID=A0A8B5Y3Y6_9BACI|nr:hypothetical protein [Peribacillus simplex]TVX83711.1 hypothetical protein FQP34_00195 [Peribacillus simplex]